MKYEGDLYRPPSEAYSLIVQGTIGCSHNRCTFCSMYKDDKFRIKSVEEIIEDLNEGRKMWRKVKRIFIADGDALIIKTEDLKKILKKVNILFPECERVGVYGSPKSILSKSDEELKELKELGLGIVYLGVESGSSVILKRIKKGVTPDEMICAGQKVMNSGIKLSTTLISGLGGKELSEEHALESAKVINEINPDYLALLTLLIRQGTEMYDDVKSGEFELLTPEEVLIETREFIKELDVENCIFRSNHASNYVGLAGTLNEDKEYLLAQIEEGLKIKFTEEDELFRRL